MLRRLKRLFILSLLLGLGLWIGNTSAFVSDVEAHDTRVISHRGIHHIYAGADRSSDACHAAPVKPIRHDFIENTLASMHEAIRLGANVVEIDVHLTQDDIFAVFHDWTVDCRTDGTGVTHQKTFAELQALDIGYRIDDGTGTFPLRGKAKGRMPRLMDVLSADMPGKFLINFKSNQRGDGITLAAMMDGSGLREKIYGVYGGRQPTQAAIKASPGLRGFDRQSLKACLYRYFALGWTGYVPESCRNTMVFVPQNYAGLLWGWPHRFTRRLSAAGTDVILVGPYDGSGFTSGIDDLKGFDQVPKAFDGYIWTNRIELIGPLVARR